MPLSYENYQPTDNITDTFSIPFTFTAQSEISVTVNGVAETGLTFPSSSTVQLTSPVAAGSLVQVRRTTDLSARAVDFASGSVLTEEDLDDSAIQTFHAAQEAKDVVNDTITLDTDLKWDADNKVIKDVANPVNLQDAATKNYIENTWLTTSDKAQLNSLNIANLNSVATNLTDVNTVATNISGVNAFAQVYRSGATDPTTSLDEGDLFYNTTDDQLKVYNGTAWETGVQGASGLLPLTGGTMTGDINLSGQDIENAYNISIQNRLQRQGDSGTFLTFGVGNEFYVFTSGSPRLQITNTAVNVVNDFTVGGDATISGDLTAATLTGDGSGLTNLDVDTYLNTSTAATNEVLSWNGSDYDWVAQSGGGGGISNVVEDTTPQLGGDLQSNGNDVVFADNDKATFGSATGGDLQISHDGTNSIIEETGTGSLYIKSNGAGIEFRADNNEMMGKFDKDSGARFYYNNSSKMYTTATGVTVQGTLTATAVKAGEVVGTISSGTLDLSTGNVFSDAPAANVTYVFNNPPASGTAFGFTLKVTPSGTYTVTWPASVDWAGGTAPTAPASGETDVFTFYTQDGGTTYYGFQAGDAMA